MRVHAYMCTVCLGRGGREGRKERLGGREERREKERKRENIKMWRKNRREMEQ